MRQLLIFIAGVGLVALVVAGVVWVAGGLGFFESVGCNDAERRVYAEFDHYGGREVELVSNPSGGFCTAKYTVDASEQEILDYNERQLRNHEWTIDVRPSRKLSELPEEMRQEITSDNKGTYVPTASVRGERGEFSYDVMYQKEGTGEAPEDASFVNITIFEDTS